MGQLSFGGASAVDVRVRGSLAAVALGTNGFALVNIANPTKPVDYKPHPLSPGGDVRDLWLSGDTLYVVSSGTGLVSVYDVTDPAAPTSMGSITIPGAVAVSGDSARHLAAVVTSSATLTVVDMSNPGAWTTASTTLAGGNCEDVVLFGTSAYTACGTSGVQRVDVTNPASPQYRASTNSMQSADTHGVAVRATPQGILVAAGDDVDYNTVPLYPAGLNTYFNLNICTSPSCSFNGGHLPVNDDANGIGVALGSGFGVQTAGPDGSGVPDRAPGRQRRQGADGLADQPHGGQLGGAQPLRVGLGQGDRRRGGLLGQIFANGQPVATSASWSASFMPTTQGPLTIWPPRPRNWPATRRTRCR